MISICTCNCSILFLHDNRDKINKCQHQDLEKQNLWEENFEIAFQTLLIGLILLQGAESDCTFGRHI